MATRLNPLIRTPEPATAPGVTFVTPNRMVDTSPAAPPMYDQPPAPGISVSQKLAGLISGIGKNVAAAAGKAGAIKPAPGAASPPAVAQPSAPAFVPPNPANAPQANLYSDVGAMGATPTIDTSALTGMPMPKQFPTLDVNKMYDPAQRAIDQRRAALMASKDRANADNQAFASYINGLTSKAATGLGSTMTQLGDQANQARQQSIDATVGSILGAGPGADNADLLAGSGGAAQAASDAALQAGQGAQNMLPSLDAKAQLQRVGLDQGAVDKASDRLMQLETGRGANAALSQVGQDESALQGQKANTTLQRFSSILGYMTDAAKMRQEAATAQAGLGSKTQGYMSQILKAGIQATGRMNVAQINQYVAGQVAAGKISQAQAHDLSQQLIGARNNKASILAASLRSSTSGQPKPGAIAAKGGNALAKFNSNQDTLGGAYTTLDTNMRGQRAQNGAAFIASTYPQMSWATAGPILTAAYPDRMKDPGYVAFAQKLFTGTQ